MFLEYGEPGKPFGAPQVGLCLESDTPTDPEADLPTSPVGGFWGLYGSGISFGEPHTDLLLSASLRDGSVTGLLL